MFGLVSPLTNQSIALGGLNAFMLVVGLVSFLHRQVFAVTPIFVVSINLSPHTVTSRRGGGVLKFLAFLLDDNDLPQELVSYFKTRELGGQRDARALSEGPELKPCFPRNGD